MPSIHKKIRNGLIVKSLSNYDLPTKTFISNFAGFFFFTNIVKEKEDNDRL